MDNTAFDIWVSNRMDFSAEDKRECFETAKIIVDLANAVRQRGLLSLDDKIASMDGALLRKALGLAVDSFGAEEIQKLVQTHIVANNYKGKRLLESLIVKEGVIAIVNGTNPVTIKLILEAYFGDEFQQEFTDYINAKKDKEPDFKTEFTSYYKVVSRGDKLTQAQIDNLIKLIQRETDNG